jgi:hypothetical protein
MTIGFLCLPVGLLCQQLAISVLKGNSIIRDLSLLLMNYVWFALLTLYPGLVLMMMSAFGTAKVPPGTDSTTARD